MYRRLLTNHFLANLAYVLVVALGVTAYLTLPRQQDPSVNFNWVEVQTRFPGASARDVEERVTDVLEKGVEQVNNIRFSRSESRAGFSRIIVRFHNLDDDAFDEHVTQLRREVQNRAGRLPDAAESPDFLEIDSANHTPAVLMLVVGEAYDENLRRQADRVADDLARLGSIDRVDRFGMRTPELQVLFDTTRMQGLGVAPAALADTVRAYFRDRAVGSLPVGDQEWLVRLSGTRNDPVYLENLPLVATNGEVPLRSVASVERGLDEATELVEYRGRPALLLALYKETDSNLLELVDRVKDYAAARNDQASATGVELRILNDQTGVTRRALDVMESNALLGLGLVLAVTWALLGVRIAGAATLGIPFALAGTIAVAAVLGETINVVVLLGLVISLGMLVDDAVVVAEAIHARLHQGDRPVDAAVHAVREVGTPVLASVMTTAAAFMPLMLIPGVLGDYMHVAPLVVTVALAVSLIEAFWILPSHTIAGAAIGQGAPGRVERIRAGLRRRLRNRYARVVIAAVRRPRRLAALVVVLLVGVAALTQTSLVRVDYFATDSARLFYINVDMPPGTSLGKTVETTSELEAAVRPLIDEQALRASASYAGVQLAQADTVMGDNVGQVAVSLHPRRRGDASVDRIVEEVEDAARAVAGPESIAFLQVKTGPPTEPPVKVKLRGDELPRLAAAADALKGLLREMGAVRDVRDDDAARRMELRLSLDPDAIVRTGLSPATVTRTIQLLADGEVVASMRDQGDTVDVRVRAARPGTNALEAFLDTVINLPDGGTATLRELVDVQTRSTRGTIRHQGFRRAITVSAELDGNQSDTLSVNRRIREVWEQRFAERFPGVDLDFSGQMDEIKESLRSMGLFFLVGLALVYTILGTQFRSYFQPLIVLTVVPVAFAGVVIGAVVSGHPLSLYTLYGAVALAGIAVNSAIVYVSAANERRRAGMTTAQATVFAARRRVVPIVITSLTTMAGLFSLAVGLAGHSSVWGPVASAIVCGLAVSTSLTLLVLPVVYAAFAPRRRRRMDDIALPVALNRPRSPGARLRAMLNGQTAEQARYREDRRQVASDRRLAAAYDHGRQYLAQGDAEGALKLFQYVAEQQPDNVLANLAAAQAALAVLQDNGWDEGYDARVSRFLRRAERRDPGAPDLLRLKRAYRDLGAPAGTDAAIESGAQ